MGYFSWIEKSLVDLQIHLLFIKNNFGIEFIEINQELLSEFSSPLYLVLAQYQYIPTNIIKEKKNELWTFISDLTFQYVPLTFYLTIPDSNEKNEMEGITIDTLSNGRNTIFSNVISKELGLSNEILDETLDRVLDKIMQKPMAFQSDKQIEYLFTSELPFFVSFDMYDYIYNQCKREDQWGYQMLLYKNALLYAIIYKLIEDNPIYMEHIKIIDCNLYIEINRKGIENEYMSMKERISLWEIWIKDKQWTVIPISYAYQTSLIQEIIDQWPSKATVIYAPFQRSDIDSYFPELNFIIIKENDEIGWIQRAMDEIINGNLPRISFPYYFSCILEDRYEPFFVDAFYRYIVTKAYLDLVQTQNPFYISYIDMVTILFTPGINNRIEISGHFFKENDVEICKKNINKYIDLIDFIKVFRMSTVSEGITFRYKIQTTLGIENSLLVRNNMTEQIYLVFIENKKIDSSRLQLEKKDDQIIMRDLKNFFSKICRDEKDYISLDDIPSLTLDQLLYLIPSEKNGKQGYCYQLNSLAFLSDIYKNPYTNVAFSEYILFYINHLWLFWSGIFPFGPVKGLYPKLYLPNISIDDKTMEGILFEKRGNFISAFISTEAEEKEKSETILFTLPKNNTKDIENIKMMARTLWKEGFFFNNWANSLYLTLKKISIFPEKNLPYKNEPEKLLPYLEYKYSSEF